MPDEIPVLFHYGSNFDCHLIIKKAKTNTAQKVSIFGGYSIFSLDAGKSRPEKLQIRTLFTQWKFEGEFSCLEENTDKYKTFLVPATREGKRTDKKGEEITETYLTIYWYHRIYCILIIKSSW